MTRVLLYSESPVLGGAEMSFWTLAQALTLREDIELFFAYNPSIELSPPTENNLPVSTLAFTRSQNGRRSPFWPITGCIHYFRAALTLFGASHHNAVDILHANGWKSAVVAVPVALFSRTRLIWHVRDYPKYPMLERFIAKVSSGVISPSLFIRDHMVSQKITRQEHCSCIPNGFPIHPTVPKSSSIRNSLAIPETSLVVAMIAQLVPWKRHDLFLNAIPKVMASFSGDVHFLVVGSDLWSHDSAYENSLRSVAMQSSYTNVIHFLGQRDNIESILAEADVMVLPSDREPFGRVIIEGWMQGIPVVVSNHGGPAEIVKAGYDGIHFKKGDEHDLADKIAQLLKDESLRQSLGENGRQSALQYSLDNHVNGVVEAYKGVMQ